MDINKVIEMGKMDIPLKIDWSSISLWWWIILIIVGLIAIFIIIDGFYMDEIGASIGTSFLLLLVFLIPTFFYLLMIGDKNQNNMEKEEVNQWKQEYVKPFINSLPYEKHEIVYVKLDPEIKENVHGNISTGLFGGYGYIETETENLVPLVVAYKNGNQIKIYKNFANADMELSKDETPYIEFKNLKKDLGNGIDKGLLNVRVFLPKDYKFDSIK